jgi:hypothetical protein
VATSALAVSAARRPEVRAPPEGAKVAERAVAHEHDIGPATAVAAVRAAARHMRLAAEGDRAVAARASLHVDFRAIVEHLQRS